MSIDFADLLRGGRGYAGQIAHVQPIPPREARYDEPTGPLAAPLHHALAALGITRLYAHQAAALDAARAGEHVGIVTATASGKTLCYQLPALEAILVEDDARALFLFPTKALAHDQLRALNGLLAPLNRALADDHRPSTTDHRPPTTDRQATSGDGCAEVEQEADSRPSFVVGRSSVVAATLDGDTPRGERDRVRARAQIVLSNPDMLHRTLLPDHRRWAALLARLRFVVLDEAHIYRGVFGTHVALVLRRLRRLCAHYGAAPQFICCSATSANPHEHLAALVGDAVRVIDEDGAPQGERTFILWNPPVIEAMGARRWARGSTPSPIAARLAPESGQRRSTNVETAGLLAHLVRAGVKTLAFTRTRRAAELVLRYARENLTTPNDEHRTLQAGTASPSSAERSAFSVQPSALGSYRAGYTPEERRRIERDFLEGRLAGLVSTNALELGVDIGGVDAVVMGGFPGSVASAWQQAGRAGRAQGRSLALLVAQDDPLDQFYMRHPQEFFSRPHEHARVALENPYILSDQLRCAAFELPLHDADETWFGPTFAAIRDWLLRRGELLRLPDGRAEFAGERWPAGRVNIRSADGEPVELRDAASGRVIEQIASTRAPFEVFPGAVYLHQGDTYLVEALHARHAEARRAEVDYYTQTIDETAIRVLGVLRQRRVGPAELFLGKVKVTRQVTGYRRKRHYTEEVLSEHDLALPPQTFRTVAVWWAVPEGVCRRVAQECGDGHGGAPELDALHAMEHACIGLLPLYAQCDRADIGGLSTDLHPDTGAATVFVYDGAPGGVGIAQVGYEQAELWWAQTHALLVDCPCLEGCPACVQSPKCGNGNQHLSKHGAAALAALLLGREPPTRQVLPSAREGTNGVTGAALLEELRARL
ncbi:MAG TPA: DEAD/DEAH box helicase, partial [Roseiflexaceae bacterium]|nr:DEAD/DEAH box helicase [Roseiflexaceae bacterium]